MNQVSINGKTYSAPDGCSISVINHKVYVDGKLLKDCDEIKAKKIEVNIIGNCNVVRVDAADLTVKGNIKGNVTVDAGNISCNGNINGDVDCDCGNITCNNISGNTKVDCGNINKNNWFNNILNKF